MTPAERARLIDQQEFEAECRAIRARALAYARSCQKQERRRVKAWIDAPEVIAIHEVPDFNKVHLKARTKRAKLHEVNGEALTLDQWALRIGKSKSALQQRIQKLGSLEAALAFKPTGRWAGVSSDFAPSEGTGAGSTAQETPEITFPEEAENA